MSAAFELLDCVLSRSPPPISPNLPTPTTTAILLTLSLKTEHVSGRLTLRQNLEALHLQLGGDRTPTLTLEARLGKQERLAIAPRHLLELRSLINIVVELNLSLVNLYRDLTLRRFSDRL